MAVYCYGLSEGIHYMPLSPPKTLAEHRADATPIQNVNDQVTATIKPLDKLALNITDRVGTMVFFLGIFTWTILWCGYNIIATEFPQFHFKPFDPFPAFVAYLLISNVIQILLMPLIMVGQNLQGAHSEKRAQNDYEVNVKAEREVELILQHLEYQNSILIEMMSKLGVSIDEAKADVDAKNTRITGSLDVAPIPGPVTKLTIPVDGLISEIRRGPGRPRKALTITNVDDNIV